VDLRLLRTFVAVAEEGNVTRAAGRLYLAQPAVSKQIQTLERQVGVALFARSARGVIPTPAGDVLLNHARSILAATQTALAAARAQAVAATGALVLGVHDEGAAELTMPILRAFEAAHPHVQLRVQPIGSYAALAPALADRTIDALIGWPAFADPDACTVTPLYLDPRVALLPADHPLAAAETVTVADLLDEPFAHSDKLLCPPAVAAHGQLAEARNDEPPRTTGRPVATMHDLLVGTVRDNAVSVGGGAGARVYSYPGVVWRPITDAASTTVAVIARRPAANKRPEELAQAFADSAQRTARELLALVPGARLPTTGSD